MKSKAAQIAEYINKFPDRRFDDKAIAEDEAYRQGVTLYWFGTASLGSGRPCAQVINKSGRIVGTITEGFDGLWRA